MQLLKDTPEVHSQSRWEGVKDYLANDPRYQAVGSDAQREAWFDEYIENLVCFVTKNKNICYLLYVKVK